MGRVVDERSDIRYGEGLTGCGVGQGLCAGGRVGRESTEDFVRVWKI